VVTIIIIVIVVASDIICIKNITDIIVVTEGFNQYYGFSVKLTFFNIFQVLMVNMVILTAIQGLLKRESCC
jgi:hypothetical protein